MTIGAGSGRQSQDFQWQAAMESAWWWFHRGFLVDFTVGKTITSKCRAIRYQMLLMGTGQIGIFFCLILSDEPSAFRWDCSASTYTQGKWCLYRTTTPVVLLRQVFVLLHLQQAPELSWRGYDPCHRLVGTRATGESLDKMRRWGRLVRQCLLWISAIVTYCSHGCVLTCFHRKYPAIVWLMEAGVCRE